MTILLGHSVEAVTAPCCCVWLTVAEFAIPRHLGSHPAAGFDRALGLEQPYRSFHTVPLPACARRSTPSSCSMMCSISWAINLGASAGDLRYSAEGLR